MKYSELTVAELKALEAELKELYQETAKKKLNIDVTRGKPSEEQLKLADGMFSVDLGDFKSENGADVRNYGGLEGVLELRKLFAKIFDVKYQQVVALDGSSLNVMYDTLQYALTFGVGGGLPWQGKGVKFLCPAPGYDRHFAVTEALGVEMITVPMTETGPDMDLVEMLCAVDEKIKGMWCVPKYSNPTGVIYSDQTVDRIAKMKTAAPDFRVFWDNAYFAHGLYANDDKLKNVFQAAEKAGNPDRFYMFASTSKITFPGSGVSAFVSSEKNVQEFLSHRKYQTIGPNKVVQLAHFKYLKDEKNLLAIMQKHADILRPKFEKVLEIFEEEFSDSDALSWSKPKGGYFISADTMDGCAARAVEIAAELGVKFTAAGSTYPMGRDDMDKNVRIAPSYPTVPELETAIRVFCLAVKIATVEKLLKNTSSASAAKTL